MLHAQITPKCIEAKSRIASPVSSLNWSTLARKGGDIIVMFCKQYTYVGWELWSGGGWYHCNPLQTVCQLGTLARGDLIANSLLVYSTDLKSFRTAPEEHRGSQIEINFIFSPIASRAWLVFTLIQVTYSPRGAAWIPIVDRLANTLSIFTYCI